MKFFQSKLLFIVSSLLFNGGQGHLELYICVMLEFIFYEFICNKNCSSHPLMLFSFTLSDKSCICSKYDCPRICFQLDERIDADVLTLTFSFKLSAINSHQHSLLNHPQQTIVADQ